MGDGMYAPAGDLLQLLPQRLDIVVGQRHRAGDAGLDDAHIIIVALVIPLHAVAEAAEALLFDEELDEVDDEGMRPIAEGFLHDGYSNSQTVQTATLPSGGYWGDIGYALLRTFPDRAELTFRQTDFYFNRRWAERPRQKNWLARVNAHDGRQVVFWYDKPGNFYKS